MKLNQKFLAVKFETNSFLKDFFIKEHLNPQLKTVVENEYALAKEFQIDYDKTITDPWKCRQEIANRLIQSPRNLKKYFITKSVQEGADLVKFDLNKVDLRMYRILPDMQCLYITGQNEMYRFEKNQHRINVLFYYTNDVEVRYDSYSIILEKDEMKLAMLPGQNKEKALKLLKLILFIEVGEISFQFVRGNGGKVVYGKGGDDKLKNESGVDVTVVNSNWNKITVVAGGIIVPGYFRFQWVGKGRTILEKKFVRGYTKGAYVINSGKLSKSDQQT